VKRKWHDPWAEYGKPITFIGAALEPDPVLAEKAHVSITELERILNSEEELQIEILPNGSIAARPFTDEERGNRKPLTMRENLGGEY
jgi:hypothetical protein